MIQQAPKIILFGGLQVQHGERVVTRFRTRKTASILAYLAFYRRRIHTREELADRFWPEDEPEAARASLRTALNSLRKQLGAISGDQETVLVSDRTCVRLRHDVLTTDVAAFEAALEVAETSQHAEEQADALRRAVLLHRGELLPEVYDEWVAPERERLSAAYTAALRRLAERAEADGDLDQALELALRLVAADSTDEATRLDAMRLYQKQGKYYEAVRQYRELERVLRDEMGLEPSDEVKAVYFELPERYRRAVSITRGRRPAAAPLKTEETSVSEPQARTHRAAGLPVALTPFFGRSRELGIVTELLSLALGSGINRTDTEAARLVTLVGPGGSGKTRLAVEAVNRLADHFKGSIWFAPLAGVSEPSAIPNALLDALGIIGASTGDWIDAISGLAGGSPCLFVLDNLEHLVPEGARYLHEMLVRIPEMVCLVTSRSRLRIQGERVLSVTPLKIPAARYKTPTDLASCESVQMFVDRARAARADFALTDRNSAIVAELCRRLDGLPLALELTASWAQVLTPAQMLDRTYARGELTSRHKHGAAERHSSLRATIYWSFEQLSIDLKSLFTRLSVFRGGWSVEAAVAVCAGGPSADSAEQGMLSDLTHLAETSLVVAEEVEMQHGSEIRFRMLETLREYAWEQMSPSDKAHLQMRHTLYFTEASEEYASQVHANYRDSLDEDYNNLTAALHWAMDSEHTGMALRLATSMYGQWIWRHRFAEGRRCLEKILLNQSGGITMTSSALHALGSLCYYMQDHAASLKYYRMQLEMVRDLGDREAVARAQSNLGNAEQGLGHTGEARRLMEESLKTLMALNAVNLIPCGQYNLADVLESMGEWDEARSLFHMSLNGYKALDNASGQAMCCRRLAVVANYYGDLAAAQTLCEQALQLEAQFGMLHGSSETLQTLADTLDALGDRDASAAAVARRELAIEHELDLRTA